jgi:plastocyanin
MSRIHRSALSVVVASLLVLALAGAAEAALTDNLIVHWELDDASGTQAADSVGSNTGTLTNMAGTEWTTGKIGGALGFPGADDYVDAGSAVTFTTADSFTVAAWAKRTTLSGSDE